MKNRNNFYYFKIFLKFLLIYLNLDKGIIILNIIILIIFLLYFKFVNNLY